MLHVQRLLALILVPVLVSSLTALPTYAQTVGSCSAIFETRAAEVAAQAIAKETEKIFGKKLRGYAVIVGTMVASAALTTHLTADLPKDMAFISNLIGPVVVIGIFALGAPIRDPILSALRKYAFRLGNERTENQPSDVALERFWTRTQSLYSINAQMSRNVIHSFLLAAHSNFNIAREAMLAGSEALATDQIAEIAVRMRRFFREIEPSDESVALAIQATFTRHIPEPEKIALVVMRQIERDDSNAKSPEAREYYRVLLATWLTSDR